MEELLAGMQRDGRLAKRLARYVREYQLKSAREGVNVALLEKTLRPILELIAALSESSNKAELTRWLKAEQERIRELKDEFRFRFGGELKTALERDGCFLSGQLPLLRAGCYTLRIDFDTGTAALFWGPEVEKLRARIPLDALAISKAVAAADRQLQTRAVKPELFARLLATAYDRLRVAKHLPDESRVSLVDLLQELAFMSQPKRFLVNPTRDNYLDYSRIQYGFDLYQLKKSGRTSVAGRQLHLFVATFDATTERARSLWVPVNDQGEGTYYSHLAFVAEGQDKQHEPDGHGQEDCGARSGVMSFGPRGHDPNRRDLGSCPPVYAAHQGTRCRIVSPHRCPPVSPEEK